MAEGQAHGDVFQCDNCSYSIALDRRSDIITHLLKDHDILNQPTAEVQVTIYTSDCGAHYLKKFAILKKLYWVIFECSCGHHIHHEYKEKLDPKSRFDCRYCDYSAGSNIHLERHENSHGMKHGDQCPLCNFTSERNGVILKHQKQYHKKVPFVLHLITPVFVVTNDGDGNQHPYSDITGMEHYLAKHELDFENKLLTFKCQCKHSISHTYL